MWNTRPRTDLLAVAFLVGLAAAVVANASEYDGQVLFSGLPVPGATVSATRDDASRTTTTDAQGAFHFSDLADGSWTITVEMIGFATLRQDVLISPRSNRSTFALTLLAFNEITAGQPASPSATPNAAGTNNASAPPARSAAAGQNVPSPPAAGFQRAAVAPSTSPSSVAPAEPGPVVVDSGDRSADTADGFLINGSVNNGAASPFAQLPAFGNDRRGPRSLYSGGFGAMLGNSAWDARPFSFSGQPRPKPSYNDAQIVASFGGPLNVPALFRSRPVLFLGYQHSSDHSLTTQSTIVPTEAERQGDLSASVAAFGRPLQVLDPTTGRLFGGNLIPALRISPQAAALLAYYPAPNVSGGRYNYETPVLVSTRQDALQSRMVDTLTNKTQLYGNVSLQRTLTHAGNVFGFTDSTTVSGIDAPMNWWHRYSASVSLRVRYQYTAIATDVTPYFAGRDNVSGDAGIGGNNQDPVNWGPPTLIFSGGIAGLSTAQYASNHDQTHGTGAEMLWTRGRHNLTMGGDIRLRHVDVVAQQNARGTLSFTGVETGSDFADFLLGLPATSAIAFGNADKRLRGSSADGYVTDDWRVSPTLTANVGLRWEFEAPFTETYGRLANLDLAPGFTAAIPVLASHPIGALTGQHYPASLIRPDFRGFEPRLGTAWRPIAGSSIVIRAGYGIYRNTSVYQSMALLLAQQPPYSHALSVETNPAQPITLANAFGATPATPNTFAVDPNFRAGYAHNWQLLLQRDLPGSTTLTVTYLGTAGRHLPQEFLPNTDPPGAPSRCPVCPVGFVYVAANGTSSREAAQVQLRRRLRNGLAGSIQYTLARATDDAPAAFTGVTLNGSVMAQDWTRLDAERAPSDFDQRHQVTAQVQYTSGVGIGGGSLMDGLRGRLLKGWTVTGQLTAGSGLPVTPVYLAPLTGTGVTGTVRADATGASAAAAPAGFYVNPAAFAPPITGQWGSAGRNSIRGPAQFGFNTGFGRSFLLSDRLTLDWRVDATNVLNRVTFSSINAIVGSPQFGLPVQANVMRKLQSTLRVRF